MRAEININFAGSGIQPKLFPEITDEDIYAVIGVYAALWSFSCTFFLVDAGQ